MSALNRISYHEAGHAVVAHLLGYAVNVVWATESGGACYNDRDNEPASYDHAIHAVTILAAGDAGESVADECGYVPPVPTPQIPPVDVLVPGFTPGLALEPNAVASACRTNQQRRMDAPDYLPDFGHIARIVDRLREQGETTRTPHEWYRSARRDAEKMLHEHRHELDRVAAAMIDRKSLCGPEFQWLMRCA